MELTQIARDLAASRPGQFPQNFFQTTSRQFYDTFPSGVSVGIVLTDDYAPTDNLLR
jgi:hypothetical protein